MLRTVRATRRAARSRTALATAVVLAVTAGLTAATAGPALAEPSAPTPAPPADEVVIPDPGRFKPRGEDIGQAGSTGYVHKQEFGQTVWTDHATGADSPVPADYSAAYAARHSGLLGHYDTTTRLLTVTDIATGGVTAKLELPADQTWIRGFTPDSLLTTVKGADGKHDGLRLLRLSGTEVTEQPVTGWPGPVSVVNVLEQDIRGALLATRTTAGGPWSGYYLDYAKATLTPTTAVSSNHRRSLGHDRLLVTENFGTVLTVPRDDPSATPVATSLPPKDRYEIDWSRSTVIGDWILVRRDIDPFYDRYTEGVKLLAVPIGGGTPRELLPHSAGSLTVTPDGSVLVVGGGSARDWAVHRVTLGEDGAPRLTVVRKVPQVPATYKGLDAGGGVVNYLSDSSRGPGQTLYEVDTRTPGDARRRFWYPTQNQAPPRAIRSLGDGQVAVSQGGSIQKPITENSLWSLAVPENADLTDAGGRYTLSSDGAKLYVGDFGDGAGDKILLTRPHSAAALWGGKLWKPAAATGKVNSYDLVTKATSADLDLGSGCVPGELQAVGRWLYWACAGGAKAGVYDTKLRKSVSVPAGEALLGDGFVVRRDNAAGKLLLTDAATGRTSEFADIPVTTATGSGRRVDWAVDRFGGGVAYIDAQKNIHVKRAPVAGQDLVILGSSVDGAFSATDADDPAWNALWRFSRPVDRWRVLVRDASGRVVRTLSGAGGPGASVQTQWDGKDDAGLGVMAGRFFYALEVAPDAGDAFVQLTNGDLYAYDTVLETAPSRYRPLAPKRVLDTRSGVGAPKAKVGPWKRVSLKVAGAGGIPATGATSVVLNVTVTNATKPGHISVAPFNGDTYRSSLVNFTAGQTASNLVVVPVVNGKVDLMADTAGKVDLVADVAGYYAAGTTGAAGSAFRPLAPTRFMDTRAGLGVPRAKIGAGGTARLQVAGVKGVPESGVTAVVMNVTATNASRSTVVTAYPDGTPRPGTSNLNVPTGRTIANLVVVPVVNGRVALTNNSGSVDLIGDVVGYYTSGDGAVFTGAEARRLMDTRTGFGVRKGAVGPGQSVTLQVGGAGPVPAKASAVVLNVTATQPTTAGYVTVHPAGTPRGTASSLNFRAGQTVPNQVVVPVVDGKVTFFNHSGNVHLIADVEGWFI
ncbi:FlgD immunoglobulin-like domain containing protein [Streptomyces sp. NPDC002328]|uniref:FlgD immunoglobulin-like domain containing protein n=1 Tax=Streptomyces sp. NPDC002328 TaxID=3364642 RepID=UPI00368AF981